MENGDKSAFPIKGEASGLSKREYLAALVMSGYLASGGQRPDMAAEISVKCADELLKALEK